MVRANILNEPRFGPCRGVAPRPVEHQSFNDWRVQLPGSPAFGGRGRVAYLPRQGPCQRPSEGHLPRQVPCQQPSEGHLPRQGPCQRPSEGHLPRQEPCQRPLEGHLPRQVAPKPLWPWRATCGGAIPHSRTARPPAPGCGHTPAGPCNAHPTAPSTGLRPRGPAAR